MTNSEPVINWTLSEAKKRTVWAISEASAIRLIEVTDSRCCFTSTETALVKPGVSVGPGLTILTLICLLANSLAAIFHLLLQQTSVFRHFERCRRDL